MNARFRIILPLIFTFAVFILLLSGALIFFNKGQIDFKVVFFANCIFFVLSLFVFRMQQKAMQQPNPNVFIRSVMGGLILKMGIVVTAVVFYVLLSRKSLNKPAVFISILLYLVYLAVEVATVMKLNKQKDA